MAPAVIPLLVAAAGAYQNKRSGDTQDRSQSDAEEIQRKNRLSEAFKTTQAGQAMRSKLLGMKGYGSTNATQGGALATTGGGNTVLGG